MRTRGSHHVVAGHRGGTSARWRRAAAVAVDPSTHTAYVTNGNASTVSVISAALPAPVTTVTSSRNPSPAGQNVTFTATVGPADGGTITFSSGSKLPAIISDRDLRRQDLVTINSDGQQGTGTDERVHQEAGQDRRFPRR